MVQGNVTFVEQLAGEAGFSIIGRSRQIGNRCAGNVDRQGSDTHARGHGYGFHISYGSGVRNDHDVDYRQAIASRGDGPVG